MQDTGTPVMAKKKSGPENWRTKPIAVQVRGSDEFKAWVEGLAEFDATSVSEMVERALAAYARQIGYPGQRPKR